MNTYFNSNLIWLQLEYKMSTLETQRSSRSIVLAVIILSYTGSLSTCVYSYKKKIIIHYLLHKTTNQKFFPIILLIKKKHSLLKI